MGLGGGWGMGNLRSTRAKEYLRPCQHAQKNEITSGQLGQQRTFLRFAFGVSKLVAMTGHGKIVCFSCRNKGKEEWRG